MLGLESTVQTEVGQALREVAEEVTQEPKCLLRSTLRAGG